MEPTKVLKRSLVVNTLLLTGESIGMQSQFRFLGFLHIFFKYIRTHNNLKNLKDSIDELEETNCQFICPNIRIIK